MKKRALVAALCCLSTASTAAVAAPVATAQTATAKKTMADQYQPTFTDPHTPFGTLGDNTAEHIYAQGVPEGTELTILNPSYFYETGRMQDGFLVTSYGSFLKLNIFPFSYRYGKSVTNTVELAVEYPDGSTEVVTHTFTIKPEERYQHKPTIDNDIIEVGKTTRLELSDVPSSASVTPLKVPEDWNVKHENKTFTVTPLKEGEGRFIYRVSFSDGSSEIFTNSVQAKEVEVVPEPTTPEETEKPEPTTPEETEKPEPTTPEETEKPVAPGDDSGVQPGWIVGPSDHGNNGGSSTVGIIAGVVGAVLAIALSIGGAAFAGLIPGLKLPF